MCAINGFFNYSRITLRGAQEHIARMNAAVSHRGPDDSGVWNNSDGTVWLGHQRLSILDLSEKGHQPMISRRGSVIVFNGEIYNFQQLRQKLPMHDFISDTDTEVLLQLYDQDGHRALDPLNGMFAFAVWDEQKGELFLARDRVGIKPLYFTTLGGVFSFSSEIKALLTLPWVKAELDEDALYDFLTFNCVPPPATMFRHIFKFPPGHKMVVGANGITRHEPYWRVPYNDPSIANEDAARALISDGLDEAVGLQMISDVPVGAFLSGGVDSSAIVALMSKKTSVPIRTYSIGFQDSADYDERKYAEIISRRYSTDHHERIVTPQDLVEFLPRVVDIFDEPLADATSIPIYFISQLAARDGTKVVLTGDGADELFCGYRNWVNNYVRQQPLYSGFSHLPRWLQSLAVGAHGLFFQHTPRHEILSRALHRQEFFWGGAGGFKEATKRSFLSEAYRRRLGARNSHDVVAGYRDVFNNISKSRHDDLVDWMCYLGLSFVVPNIFLYRADHLGMANSIELRVPYLDHHFVETALSIPSRYKVANNEPKYILKRSLEHILPRDILYRKKQGFCVPLDEWSRDYLLSYVETHLDSFCRDTGLFDADGLRAQVRAVKRGGSSYVFTLWNIYFLMVWFKKWLG